MDPQTRLIAARERSPVRPSRANLQLDVGAPTIFIERLRLADGEPLLLEQVHLSAERFPGLLGADLERESLYRRPERSLRDRYRANPRDLRTGPVAQARSRLAGNQEAPAGAAGRRRGLFRRWRASRVLAHVRARRPHPLFRRTQRQRQPKTVELVDQSVDTAGACAGKEVTYDRHPTVLRAINHPATR